MPNGVVNRTDFDKLKDVDVKLGVLFETGIKTQKILQEHMQKTEKRFEAGTKRMEKIEKRALRSGLTDKGFSGMMGLIGGFIASYLRWK